MAARSWCGRLPHGGAYLLRTGDVLRRPRDRRDPALDGRRPRAHGAHALIVRRQACRRIHARLGRAAQPGPQVLLPGGHDGHVLPFHPSPLGPAHWPEAQVKPIQVGLLGLGTVGSGTIEVLRRNREEIRRRAGRDIVIKVAGARDLTKERAVSLDGIELVANAGDIVTRPDIDIVVELIGGETDARALVLKAIDSGKHVVTANKALLAKHGTEIFARAHARGVMVAFEASVAGGVPIIKAIREGLTANRIEWIAGIINGTCNYILSEMRDKGLPFDMVLAEAQRLGYAEADPVDVTRMATSDPEQRVPHLAFQPDRLSDVPILSMEEVQTASYLRLRAIDRPGVLADVTRICADLSISIDAIFQKEAGEGEEQVDVVILTHLAPEKNVNAAIRRIEALPTIPAPVVRIRLEELL